jgi:hypothetical protein
MSINTIGSSIPIQVGTFGGTGNGSLGADGILYAQGTGPIGVTSSGTAGQILTSQGSSAPPIFANPPVVGGDLVFVSSIPLPTNSPAVFTSLPSNYNTYMFVVNRSGAGGTTAGAVITLQLSTDNGSTYITSFSSYATKIWSWTPSVSNTWNNITAIGGGLPLYSYAMSNSTGIFIVRGLMQLGYPSITGDCSGTGGGGASFSSYYIGGAYSSSNPAITANAFRLVATGSFTGVTGTVDVYQIRS